jgi:hypothetical protein
MRLALIAAPLPPSDGPARPLGLRWAVGITLSTAIEKTAGEIETAKEQLQAFVSALIL